MIVLGVDPGTLITGYGIVTVQRGSFKTVDYNVIRNRSSDTMPIRLRSIYETLTRMMERYHPDEFAIETAFYGKNAQSALKLGHARGVSILAAVKQGIPTAEYSPREIKKAVVGNGAASKQQVQYMVRSILALNNGPTPIDASDALAVAICHAQHMHKRRHQPLADTKRTHAKDWESFVNAHPDRVRTRS